MGAVQTANPPSFESVWAVLDRVGERLDRVGERLDRVGKSQEELSRQIAECRAMRKKTSASMIPAAAETVLA